MRGDGELDVILFDLGGVLVNGRWFSREQLTAWMETSPETLTPAFRYIWKRLPLLE